MNFSKKTIMNLTVSFFLIGIILMLFLVGEIVIPFVLAMFIVYLLNPFIIKIRKRIVNRNLAVTTFLLGFFFFVVGSIFLLGDYIDRDTNRLVSSVEIFIDENEEQIKDTKKNVLNFFNDIYESEIVQNEISNINTTDNEESKENLLASLESVYSFFFDNSEMQANESDQESWSLFYILINTILYTILILYTYEYFQEKFTKYFIINKSNSILQKFKIVFMEYFKQRSKVVVINILIFMVSFSIINLPGAIVIGLISGLLTYASHFHYFSLPLTIVGCWVLSIELQSSFFLFFGIVLLVYLLISILEETLFFSKIMNSVNGMNPALMMLAFTLSIYIFGSFTGTVVALPLARLIMIATDRFLFNLKKINI